ncbi:hypothetical protein K1T71_005049 [Dendrolimus kikuchii]|uniref:Uncharacterized protein n=1 Tax=Dendrolimus kikuchii TaxID=765133 RepID=A0ACC1D723_9NEOP|nr:hypothetical protein K1T71_005049 [Dendrolimus kikuchii]
MNASCDIVGIGNNPTKIHKYTELVLHSNVQNVAFKVKCHLVDTITSKLPQQYFDISNIVLPQNIKLADEDFNVPSEIQLLLGADFYFKIIQEGQINLNNGIILQNTMFGYIVGGSTVTPPTLSMSKNETVNLVSNFVMDETKCDLQNIMENFWLAEKVPLEPEISSECQQAENNFQNTVRLIDNRFFVDMPLKLPIEQLQLGNSFYIALQRFYTLENKFRSHPKYFLQYKNFIGEYIRLGHAKIVDISIYDINNDPVYFLSHHAVLNEASKTTKLRVVFNGSMPSKNGTSLNDKMLNGPIVQNQLLDILILFRTYRFTLICDIEKMFRQVHLNKSQLGLINILWRDDPSKPILCLQLQTVTYGLKASTFLSTRCLLELALKYKDQYPLASQALVRNTYVDDVICGGDDIQHLQHLKMELIELLKKGSFNLHKWCSNVNQILINI